MLRVRNLALRPDEDRPEKLKRAAAAALGIAPGELRRIVPVRRSIDARKRDRLRILYTVDVETEREDELLRLLPDGVAATPEARYCPPSPQREPERRPVVAGFGPAGMFIALTLA